MEVKEFNSKLDLWSESLANKIDSCLRAEKRVYVIALSRKMPRFFDWLRQSVEKQTITLPNVINLCKLLNSDGVEITTEYAIPLVFDGYLKSSKKIAGIIADDVIIYGATLQRVSMQWWAFSGEVPYVIALFRGEDGVISSILESDFTIKMTHSDKKSLETALDLISRNIHSTSLPIDIEYPLIYSELPYESVKKHIIAKCPSEWIKYDVKSDSYKDSAESFSVLLVNGKNDGYTNDHAKIRLFKKSSGCCLEMIAPSYVNVLRLKNRGLFDFDTKANECMYTKAWLSVFDALHIDKDDGNAIFATIQKDQINQAILSSLIIWAEYLYCLSAFVRNRFNFFPEDSDFNIHEEDLALILGKNAANVVFKEIVNILKEDVSLNLEFEPVLLQEYVNPEKFRDEYFRRLAAVLKEGVSVAANLDALYSVSHFSSDLGRLMSQENDMGHHCIGETFESLTQRIKHKHPGDNGLFTEINKWVDVRIDECRLAPKYEIVKGSDNQRYFRRFLLCGSNKM